MKIAVLIVLSLGITNAGFAKSEGSHHAAAGVNPETAMTWLKNGNNRYLENKLRKDGQGAADRDRLAKGQNPHTIVLSCSDSRVPPEVVFDQKLGEIFVVRTAGETLADNAVGSVEYAVDHLGAKLIVVMGHTSCGAVKAALGTLNGSSAGTPALDGLVKDIHPRLAAFKGKAPTANVSVESWANARGVADDLLKRSKLIAEKVDKQEVQIVASLYDLETGKVVFDSFKGPLLNRSTATHEEPANDQHSDHHEEGHGH